MERQTFTKNGKPYERIWEPCTKCNGFGDIARFSHYAKGICFKCEGKRGRWIERRILTEKEKERREKAKARKEARKEAERQERMEEAVLQKKEKLGFTNGSVFVVIHPDTFSIKDQLKEEGAKFHGNIGWYFSSKPENYETVEVTEDEALEIEGFSVEVKNIKHLLQAQLSTSEFQGNIGDKITVEVTLKRSRTFESQFGIKHLHIFKDDNGNLYKWSTTKYLAFNEGDKLTLSGTVKDHTEFRGEKQTELTRCKVQ